MSEKNNSKKIDKDSGVVVVARALAGQLGSDQAHLIEQQIDQRKFAILHPLCRAAMGHFNYRAGVDQIRYYGWVIDWELNSSPSENGVGRRQAIQMVNAAAGGGKGSMEVADRPNILQRNLTQRNWKERAVKEGKVIPP